MFSLGAASGLKGTANAWSAGSFFAASGSVNVVSTLNAIFRITQVQLEYGTVQTPLTVMTTEQGAMESQTYNPYLQAPFRNRIINGDMRFDQRYNGGAVTINAAANTYAVDRWMGFGQPADGVFTLQRQNTTPPKGFDFYLRAAVTTADATIGASQIYLIRQFFEGHSISDLDWGLSTAKAVTVSFWVRSSLTGPFSGAVLAGDASWSCPFVYMINNANTWEYKTVTVPGPTSGAGFVKDTGAGAQIIFTVGYGTSQVGIPFAWANAAAYAVTGCIQLISTLSATLDITGVQLEPGSVATPFERRSYAVEQMLCYRYYEIVTYPAFYLPTTAASVMYIPVYYKVVKRVSPTSITLPASTNQAYNNAGAVVTPTTWATNSVNVHSFSIGVGNASLGGHVTGTAVVDSEY
jgi:hypothetical protein